MNNRRRTLLPLIAAAGLAIVAMMGTPAVPARLFADAAPQGPLRVSPLVVGMPREAFANLNESDAEVAYRAFMIAAGRNRGYELKPELRVFDTVTDLAAAVRNGSVNVASVTTWQLLETNLRDSVDLAFVPMAAGTTTRRLLLLVRNEPRAPSVAELRGKSLLELHDSVVNLAGPWVDTLTLEAGVGSAESFFGAIDLVSRPNSALLPVFFGRADACVIDERSFAVACELNPQLRTKLTVVAQSAPLLDSVICLNRIGWLSDQYREDLRQSLTELHTEPSGRQMLTLFHLDRLVPFVPDMLDSVVQLHASHARLQSTSGSTAAIAQVAPAGRSSP